LNTKTWVVVGASLGTLGIAAGTFGAHLLPKYLEAAGASAFQAERLNWWETGVRYQMYHAFALLTVAWIAERRKSLLPNLAGLAMFAGTIIFSGCLYALGLTGVRAIGAIVPIGGMLFITGWVLLAIAGLGLVDGSSRQDGTTGKKKPGQNALAPEDKPAQEPPKSDVG
jgi:uncharacterized membrane protein YgdD (TMEM256/DUF423 family)